MRPRPTPPRQAISSSVRRQPTHRPLASSIAQTETQGEATTAPSTGPGVSSGRMMRSDEFWTATIVAFDRRRGSRASEAQISENRIAFDERAFFCHSLLEARDLDHDTFVRAFSDEINAVMSARAKPDGPALDRGHFALDRDGEPRRPGCEM